MVAERVLHDLILRAIGELEGQAKPSQIARLALATGCIEEASLRSIKAEIWRMVDQGDLIWTSDREIMATREASRD